MKTSKESNKKAELLYKWYYILNLNKKYFNSNPDTEVNLHKAPDSRLLTNIQKLFGLE